MNRWIIPATAAVLVLAGSGIAYAARSTSPSVVFSFGGAACYQASCAGDSANVPSGQAVNVSSGSAWVVAAGDGQVMCRITVDGKLVAEAHAAGAGQRAFCAF
jgi:hypothetical protein